MRRLVVLPLLAIVAIWTVACSNTPEGVKPPASPSPAAPASPAAQPASPSSNPATNATSGKADSLVGKWTGSENASLTVAKKGDKFSIEIAGKDGTKSFEGTAKGDVIEFTRDGKTESIKVATGAETGVKGLEKESNCVVVTKGTEGYCRK